MAKGKYEKLPRFTLQPAYKRIETPLDALLTGFGYTAEEISQLKTLGEEGNAIQEQLKLLQQKLLEISTSINSIKEKEDSELRELLDPRLNPNKEHTITCVSIREDMQLKITISSCDAPREIEKFFNSLLKTRCQAKKFDSSKWMEKNFKIIVTIELSEREHLIEGLKLSQEVLNLPSAHRHLDGC